jgi:hypothetical protein
MRMAEENVDEALKWAATIGTEHEGAAALGHIALVISATDPERAGTLLSETGIEGRDFDVVVVQVLGRWAARSPADAAAWVALFPPGESREAGMRPVVSAWAEADADALLSWMAGLRDEALRGESAQAMAEVLLRQPDEVREAWLSHADPQLRTEIEARREAVKKETGNMPRPPSK